jgi:Na+/glutamate symporter
MVGMQDGKESARDRGSKEEQTKLLPHMSSLKNPVRMFMCFALVLCVGWIILSLLCIRFRAPMFVCPCARRV